MRQLYWIKKGLMIALASLVGTLAYTLLTAAQNTTWQELLFIGAVYILTLGSFLSIAIGNTLYQTQIPLTISFGATRKETLIGIQLFRLASALPLLAISVILMAIAEPDYVGIVASLGAVVIFMLAGLGGAVGTLISKFSQRTLLLICFPSMILLLTVMGVVCYLLIDLFGLKSGISWVICALGAVIYAVCSLIEAKAVKRFCVR